MEGPRWEVTRKSLVKLLFGFKPQPTPLNGKAGLVQCEGEAPLQIEIFLTNVNVLLQRAASRFSELLQHLPFLKISLI